MSAALDVLWHDLECGNYAEDFAFWRDLAAREGEPVLDIGAGTGRISLDLARAGVEVVALDREEAFLAALRERGQGLAVTTVAADAREYDLGRRFPLILAPMQTVQLLGGAEGRARFLAAAAAHLEPGGLLACAMADALDAFDAEHDQPPAPDRTEVDGVAYASHLVAVHDRGDRAAIERIRSIDAPGRTRTATTDIIELDRVEVGTLQAEAARHGLRAEAPLHIPETEEYLGSTVAMLRA
ncbi:MAG: class I SAM-dependent methyltransferase [Solirubrobacteraceae bacterium]